MVELIVNGKLEKHLDMEVARRVLRNHGNQLLIHPQVPAVSTASIVLEDGQILGIGAWDPANIPEKISGIRLTYQEVSRF